MSWRFSRSAGLRLIDLQDALVEYTKLLGRIDYENDEHHRSFVAREIPTGPIKHDRRLASDAFDIYLKIRKLGATFVPRRSRPFAKSCQV